MPGPPPPDPVLDRGRTADDDLDLVVLGAGPAGLAVARGAAEAGHRVVLCERAGRPGGLAASFDVAGVRVDHGSHRLHPATPPDVLADLRALLGDDLQTRPRHGRLRVHGRWVGFPLRGGELLSSLPRPALARIARDAAAAPLRRRRTGSYAELLTSSLGPELYRALYAPYAEKLWGLPGEHVDAEQARVRVTADSPWKVAAKVLRPPADGQGRVFHYPRRGFGQIVDVLAEAAVAAGADMRLSTEVTGVEPHPERPVVTTADGGVLRPRRVLSTVPLPVLARLCSAPAEVLDAAAGLSFRAMTLVYVELVGRPWSPYDAHYFPGPTTPVTRLSEPTNYRDSDEDPADRTVLCAEVPCAVGDAVWTETDEELGRLVARTAADHDLPPVRPVSVTVRRAAHVYPVYARGYAGPLRVLGDWALTVPGVTTLGRLGLFAHDNTHHALVMARDAVAALGAPGDRWDVRAWSAARERFRGHVVED